MSLWKSSTYSREIMLSVADLFVVVGFLLDKMETEQILDEVLKRS